MSTPIRSFLAIRLARPQVEALARLCERLVRTGADVRWVAPETLHLTLRFLGDVEPERLERVKEVAGTIAAGTPRMEGRLHGIGAFPNLRGPKVVWVGMTFAPDAVRTLVARLEAELAPVGFAPDPHPFAAHVTIGRARSPRGRKPLVAELDELAGSDFGTQPVDSFTLFRSDLSAQGPTYTVLAEFAFPGK